MDLSDILTLNFLNGLGTVGTWAFIGTCLIFGKGLALQREVTQRDQTIEWQRVTIEEKDAQIRDLIMGTRVSVDAFKKVGEAVAIVAEGGEGP